MADTTRVPMGEQTSRPPAPATRWSRLQDAVLGPRAIDPPLRMLILILAAMKVLPLGTAPTTGIGLAAGAIASVLVVLAIWFPKAITVVSLLICLPYVAAVPSEINPFFDPVVVAAGVSLSHRRWKGLLLSVVVIAMLAVAVTAGGASDSGLALIGSIGFLLVLALVLGFSAAVLEMRNDARIDQMVLAARADEHRRVEHELLSAGSAGRQEDPAATPGVDDLEELRARLLGAGQAAQTTRTGQPGQTAESGQPGQVLDPDDVDTSTRRTAEGLIRLVRQRGLEAHADVGPLPIRAEPGFTVAVQVLLLDLAAALTADGASRTLDLDVGLGTGSPAPTSVVPPAESGAGRAYLVLRARAGASEEHGGNGPAGSLGAAAVPPTPLLARVAQGAASLEGSCRWTRDADGDRELVVSIPLRHAEQSPEVASAFPHERGNLGPDRSTDER
ncbi:hypothetical protein ACXET9_13505 [Brachybacterium sp. DNPG3]